MTDHPIPDDLVSVVSMWLATDDHPEAASFEGEASDLLDVIREWADGALIDPNGWRRIDAKHRMMTDREGDSYYTLTERADQ